MPRGTNISIDLPTTELLAILYVTSIRSFPSRCNLFQAYVLRFQSPKGAHHRAYRIDQRFSKLTPDQSQTVAIESWAAISGFGKMLVNNSLASVSPRIGRGDFSTHVVNEATTRILSLPVPCVARCTREYGRK